jgi:Flp pilus assembly pilin Flp
MKNDVNCYVCVEPIPGAASVLRHSLSPAPVKPPALPASKRLTLLDSIRRPGRLRRFTTERLGQDLIEYALLAGFVAVAGGAIFPSTLMPAVSGIFSKLGSYFAIAATGGS